MKRPNGFHSLVTDPRKELADSLPLCHPNDDYLKDFTPMSSASSLSLPTLPTSGMYGLFLLHYLLNNFSFNRNYTEKANRRKYIKSPETKYNKSRPLWCRLIMKYAPINIPPSSISV